MSSSSEMRLGALESGWGDLEADESIDDVSSSNVVDEESVRSAGGGTWSMMESQSGGISATALALAPDMHGLA